MSNKLIVAAAQTGPVFTENPEAMLPAAIAMMEEAANRNVAFVTFSELFMAPFFPNTLRRDFDHFFTAPDGPLMQKLCGLSKQHGIATIWPFGERTPGGDFRFEFLFLPGVVLDKLIESGGADVDLVQAVQLIALEPRLRARRREVGPPQST